MIDDLPPRLRRRVEVAFDGCWLWTGSIHSSGYGQIETTQDGRRVHWLAHRLVWESLVAEPLAENMHHRCQVKLCVNPEHLVPMSISAHAAHHQEFEPTCSHGHPWTPENTYYPDRGGRQCRACKAERQRRRYHSDPQRFNREGSERRRRKRAMS